VNDETATESELDLDGAAERIASGAELIDVRRPYEFEGGRIPGARNIEMNELTAAAESLPRDRPIVFYCRAGNRSAMAAQAFREAGYDARSIVGGIEAWAEDGRELDPADGEVRKPPPPS
jgi:rhodanese-related sulfurtransferase